MCRVTTLDRNAGRRNATRYKLQLPVIFQWEDGNQHIDGGFTSDVGLDGALISSKECPPLGADIRLEILIPSPCRNGHGLHIECIGKVTQVAERLGCHIFGVEGHFDDDHLSHRES